MGRSPIGYSVGRVRPQILSSVLSDDSSAPLLSPSSQWNGVAASGFSSTPTDQVRTTAKPAGRLVTVPGQRFTNTHHVGFLAFANDNGTLIGGVDRVRFRFEGRIVDVMEMTARAMTRHDGSTYFCWAYWVTMQKPAGQSGDAQLYIEAIPADATMQSRVMGPYLYSMGDTEYTYELEVAPSQNVVTGTRYQSIGAALIYLRSVTAQSARVTITEAGTYDISSAGVSWTANNWLTITATEAVTIARSTYTGDVASQMRPQVPRLHFQGSNITVDLNNISQIRPETTSEYWYDGIKFTNSVGNRYALWRSGVRPYAFISDGAPYYTDCAYEFANEPCNLAQLARGNIFSKGMGDYTGDGHCIIYNKTDDFDPTINDAGGVGFLGDLAALEVLYTGSEASATLALAGGSDAATRTFTATWGANSATFVVGSTEARYTTANVASYDATTDGVGYYFQDVADWLSSLTGWSATVLDDTRRASSASLAGLKGTGFGATNVKDSTLTLVSCFDQHADFYQQRNDASSGNPTDENVIIAFNQNTNCRGQQIYLGPLFGEACKDYAVVCNAMHNKTQTSQYADYSFTFSAFRGPHSHVMTVHNSWASQGFTLRATETSQSAAYQDSLYHPDDYNLIANNVTRHFQWYLGETLAVGFLKGNHSQLTTNLAGDDTTTGGDMADLFSDAAEGNFSPVSVLLSALKPPAVDRDIRGIPFELLDAAGAVGTG